jgi:thiamine biosynthesis lipoprotein
MPGILSRRNFLSLDFGDRRAAGDHWVRVHRVAMACRFEVMLSSDDAIDMDAARAALDEADAVEDRLTLFRDSEMTALNGLAASEPVVASPELFSLLALSAQLHAQTDGAFDVTSTPLSRCWSLLARDGRAPGAEEIEQARTLVGMAHVRLDADRQSVSFARDGVEIGFGAIGKGAALDRMAGVLRSHGARRSLLAAGTSTVLAIGGRGRGWPVDLRPRLAARSAGRLWIRDGAVSTSGAGEPSIAAADKRCGHVIDPRTGYPAGEALAATAVTRDAAVADALSTAFLVGGAPLAHTYCSTYPDTLAVLVLDDAEAPIQIFGRYDGATLEDIG